MDTQITITGVDELTPLEKLPRGVEIGVLYSPTSDRSRYPKGKTLDRIINYLIDNDHPYCLHVCGQGVRELIKREIEELVVDASRIQVNGRHHRPEEIYMLCDRYQEKQIITQWPQHRRPEGIMQLKQHNHQILVDASGGRGESPDTWESPGGDKPVGYAGGLTPENVADELLRLKDANIDPASIDTETGVRDDEDWFCVEKANAFVEAVRGE